jgi:hypothetical protein
MKFRIDVFRRLGIVLVLVAVFVPISAAQMRGAIGRPVSGSISGSERGARGGIGQHHGMRQFARGIFPGSPFFYSDDDPGASYVDENSAASAPPPVVVMRSSAEDSPQTKPGPLLIEWQGDRYVRFGAEQIGERGNFARPDYALPIVTRAITKAPVKALTSAMQQLPAQPLAGELPLAVLIYRDGHREEISDYAIVDGMIYVRGNYWQDGYWTKHIPISALDPPATVQANLHRGVRFMLPSASNVVIASF